MTKILVTGGTGYIGSHTGVELQQAGFEVLIIDNLSNSEKQVLAGIEKITGTKPKFFQFDLCDEKKVIKFFEKNKIDAVIHFAALKSVNESVREPLKYFRNNLLCLLNVLTAMKMAGVHNLVFSSSCTVYGQPEELPVTENAPFKKALSPYGATKQMAEEILENFCSSSKEFQVISLRYFNPIGAHDSAFIGENPSGVPNNLVPYITQTAIGRRQKLSIFGNDYNTPDGTCIRDYIHVVDLAQAHISALNRLIERKNQKNCEVFNLGTGQGVSVLTLVKTFEKVSGLKLNYEIVDRRAGDIEKVWADPAFANRELGWKAERSIEDGLLSAWKWQQNLDK